MPRTLNDYLGLMRHGLGKTPDSRHSLLQTFNDAGRALFSLAEGEPHFHEWSWTTRFGVPFTLPGGMVDTVELPADFGAIIGINFENATVGVINPTDLAHLTRLRRNETSDPLRIFVAFDVGQQQPNGSTPPRKVAAFWPRRETELSGITMSYRRTWVDMLENDLNRYPDIPAEFERLLVCLSRAYAVHTEDQADAHEDTEVVNELARLVRVDGGKQVNFGPPTHSVRRAAAARGAVPGGAETWYGRRIIRP